MFEGNQSALAFFLPLALVFVVIEALIAYFRKEQVHSLPDTMCNLAILLVGRLTQPIFTIYLYFSLSAIEKLAPFHLPESTATTVAAILFTDFIYYWQHRWSHTNRYLWFFHEVHHSSKYFNLATSFRLHWLGRLTGPIFFAPAILLGFHAEQVALFFVFNLFYQFFLHTKLIGKIPFVEGIFNTPSAHRVHHSRNKQYLNKNFGGILMLWDHIFGTYQSEEAEPIFGTIGRFESTNPFTVQFHKLQGYNKIADWLSSKLQKKEVVVVEVEEVGASK